MLYGALLIIYNETEDHLFNKELSKIVLEKYCKMHLSYIKLYVKDNK